MADPLSTTASIIAVLQISGEIIKYLRDIKNRDSPRLRSCLRSTEGVLETLRETIEDAKVDSPATWSKTIRNLDEKDGPLQQLSNALTSINTILQKHATGPRKFLWPFKKDDVDDLVRTIESQKLLLALALENDHIALSKAIHQETKDIKTGVNQLRAVQESYERKELLEWLSNLDFTPQLHDFLSKREEGSGQWFLSSTEYQTWTTGPGKTLLCPGLPGAGKTIMASIAVEHLIDTNVGNPNVGVAYVFCNYQPTKVQKLEDLLSCLLKQLVQRLPDVPDSVNDLHETSLERGIRPSLDDIGKALHSTTQLFDRVFIVIDALDEYYVTDKDSLSKLLSTLFEVQEGSSANILATSRFNSEVTSQFPEKALTKEIRADDEDVLRYINSRIPGLLSSRIARYPELMQSIRDEVLKRVDGMFLLSRLHMDALTSQPSVGHIKRTLKDLPKGLDGLDKTYENALQRMDSQTPEQRELAKKVLSWIFKACRALSTTELQHAIAVEPDMEELDRDFLPDVELLDALCAGLVTVDKQTNVVRLVHYTTREFFERNSFLTGAEMLLAETCITYLSFDEFAKGVAGSPDEFEDRLSNYELLSYAATYLGDHLLEWRNPIEVGDDEKDNALFELVLGFLNRTELVDATFQALMYWEESDTTRRRLWRPSRMTGLHLAAYLGLNFLITHLLTHGAQQDAKDAGGMTPLAWAVLRGHHIAAELLLGNRHEGGLDTSDTAGGDKSNTVNIADNNGFTPFFHAVMADYEHIADMLVEHGADPNLAGAGADSPLLFAIRKSRLKAVKYLASHPQIDVNRPHARGLSALGVAVVEGDLRIAKCLIACGAHLEVTNALGQTALHIALEKSIPYDEARQVSTLNNIIDAIIDAGANLEHRNARGQTPLEIAIKDRMTRPVESIVNAGADLSTVDEHGATPLTNATKHGLVKIVDALVRGGADVNIPDSRGYSPLMLCACLDPKAASERTVSEMMEMARLLLAAGARVNDKDPKGRTAAHKAAYRGYTDLLVLLGQQGATFDDVDSDGYTTLMEASFDGHSGTVEFLLGQAVDLDAVNKYGRSALSIAVKFGETASVEMLLAAGARVDDMALENALESETIVDLAMIRLLLGHAPELEAKALNLACWASNHKAVEMLLARGTDPNWAYESRWGVTALMVAAAQEDRRIAQLLLAAGADVDKEDNSGDYAHCPLCIAQMQGNPGILEMFKGLSKRPSPSCLGPTHVESPTEPPGATAAETRSLSRNPSETSLGRLISQAAATASIIQASPSPPPNPSDPPDPSRPSSLATSRSPTSTRLASQPASQSPPSSPRSHNPGPSSPHPRSCAPS